MTFGDLTRAAHTSPTATATGLRMDLTSTGNAGLVTTGKWTVGTVLPIEDVGLPLSDFLFPPGVNARSVGCVRITSVDMPSDAFTGELRGIAVSITPSDPFSFIQDIRREGGTLVLRAKGEIPAGVLVEAGSACDDGLAVVLPTLSVGLVPDVETVQIYDIVVADPEMLAAPYEIRLHVPGAALPSNEVLFDGVASVVGAPPDNCFPLLCADRDDPDNDAHGTPCDNCPTVYNPDQEDWNGNGIGVACDPTDVLESRPGEVVLVERPNPSLGSTGFTLSLPEETSFRMEIFDVMGRRVAILREGKAPRGVQQLVWNGQNASGQGPQRPLRGAPLRGWLDQEREIHARAMTAETSRPGLHS